MSFVGALPVAEAVPRVGSGTAPAIGIDVGASKIVATVVDVDGRMRHPLVRHRTPDSTTSLVGLLARMVTTLRQAFPDVRAVGVGIAGLVTWPDGDVGFAANHGHGFLRLGRNLTDRCDGLPVVVDNDANAAAWAEACAARHRDRSLLFLAAGTGIGSGYVVGQHLMRDPGGRGFEIGHAVVDRDSVERCACGKLGCLEALASGRAQARAAERLVRANPRSALAERVRGAPDKTSAMIDAALGGDPDAVSLVCSMGRLIGRAVAENVMTFGPVERVAVGGGLAVLGRHLLDPMRAECLKVLRRSGHGLEPRIDEAAHRAVAVPFGAALLAHQKVGSSSPSTEGGRVDGRRPPSGRAWSPPLPLSA